MSFLAVSIEEIKKLAFTLLRSKGATEREAEIVIEDYLDADLRGRTSHGFISFATALSAFPHEGRYEVKENQNSLVFIEGNGDTGHVVAREAIDLALPRLATQKVLAVGLRNITRFNTPGAIARYGAKQGAITIALEYGGKNFLAPHGGKQAALSTNPIGIGIPGTDPLFVLDIATSERAIGYVTLAQLLGEAIPEHWAVDAEGKPTTEASKVAAVQPFGGYKGYALSLAFEILAGALVRVPIGSLGTLQERGALILLLHPTIFGHTSESFSEQVGQFLHEISSSLAVDEGNPVRYPGQASEHRLYQQVTEGNIFLPANAVEQLREAVRALG